MNECDHVDCTVSEPRELVLRTVKGVDWSSYYCTRHDPLCDADAAYMWERPARGVAGDD